MGIFPNPETQFKAGFQQVELARKAGRSKSPKKSLGAKYRWLKKRALDGNIDYQRFYDIVNDPNAGFLDVWQKLDEAEKTCNNATQRANIQQVKVNLLKYRHGEKHKVESQNLNVNLNLVDYATFIEIANQRTTPSDNNRTDSPQP